MKTIQLNRQNRDYRVKASLENEDIAPVLNEIDEYPGLKTLLDTYLEELDELQRRQFTELRALHANLRHFRKKTSLACQQLAAALKALGIKKEDPFIYEPACITKTSLKELRHQELVAKSQSLVDLARHWLPDLAIYRISPEVFATLEATVKSFATAVAEAEKGRATQTYITSAIGELLRKIDKEVLERIAVIVETLKEEQAHFYASFRIAYHVVRKGGSSLSATGVVLDDATGLPIKHCKILITAAERQQEPVADGDEAPTRPRKPTPATAEQLYAVKMTSVNGRFRYKSLDDGAYEITAFRMGFYEKRALIYVNRGECADVKIRLERLRPKVVLPHQVEQVIAENHGDMESTEKHGD